MFVRALEIGHGRSDGFEIVERKFQPFDFLSFVERNLSEERISPPPDVNTEYRISGMPYMCARAEAIRSKNQITIKNKIDITLQKTFDFGTAFHSLVQDRWLGKFGILFGDWKCGNCGRVHKATLTPDLCVNCGNSDEFRYVELEVYLPQHSLRGHPDGIIIDGETQYVMELKSSNSIIYDMIARSGKPLLAHLIQVNLYMYFLEIHRSIVVYFNKNNSSWMQFHVNLDMELVDRQLDKIKLAKKSILNGDIPVRTECKDKSCSMAKKCPVAKLCFEKK